MEESIIIHYEPHVQEKMVQEFANRLKIRQTRIVNTKNLEHLEAAGGVIHDIVIFLSRHTTELLIGVLGNLLTDELKTLYRKLKSTKKNGSIEVNVSGNEYRAKFIVKRDVSEDSIEICFDELKELIQSGKPKVDAQNPNHNDDYSSKPSVQYYFDEDFQVWIPTDFVKNRKELDKAHDEMGRWNN